MYNCRKSRVFAAIFKQRAQFPAGKILFPPLALLARSLLPAASFAPLPRKQSLLRRQRPCALMKAVERNCHLTLPQFSSLLTNGPYWPGRVPWILMSNGSSFFLYRLCRPLALLSEPLHASHLVNQLSPAPINFSSAKVSVSPPGQGV